MLVAALLASANRRCTSGSPFWFPEVARLRLRPGSNSPGFTEPTLVLCSPAWLTPHQVSARFRPRTTTDSPVCSRSTPLPRSANSGGALSLRSDGRKLARQSEQLVRAPRKAKGQRSRGFARPRPAIWPRCSAYRPGQAIARDASHGPVGAGSACQYGARLRLSPRSSNMAARLRHGQDMAIIREIGHFRTASISRATLRRTEMTELTHKSKLV